MIDIVISTRRRLNFSGYRLIVGFPDVGLSGSIAAEHFQSKLGMEEIGYIESELLPPIAIVEDGLTFRPITIHVSEEHKIVLIKSYLNINAKLAYPLSRAITKWAVDMGIKEIIAISGFVADEDEELESPSVYLSANTKKLLRKRRINSIIRKEYAYLWTGSIYGLIAQILLDSTRRNLDTLAFIVETKSEYPDARAAAKVLEVLSFYLNLEIDLQPLLREAEDIENQVKAVIDNAASMQEMMESHSAANLMYR